MPPFLFYIDNTQTQTHFPESGQRREQSFSTQRNTQSQIQSKSPLIHRKIAVTLEAYHCKIMGVSLQSRDNVKIDAVGRWL